ncbi:hypothetical protein [Cronobacter dublinensis]|uniref:hypothetical protein n=1 Tax=Cronobacter dublinensis TaxID=413497 RepID=UPI000CFB9C0B|nr:hypothetical protein [Cronobacter dublinensis]
MDKSREQFDQWLKQQGLKPVAWIKDEYWKVWKASRAAVEIELPKYHEYTNQDTTRAQAEKSAYNSGVYDSAESIRAAGLKVKGE